jgi:hypothetical protein
MTTTIKLRNSVTTTNAPSTLQQGEVAINVTDSKVWVGNAATTPVQLLGAGATGSFSALSCTTLSASGVATFSAGTVSAPAITTTGDTNTGIFFPAADTIAFSEGGAESMRIDSSGRVIVGYTASVGTAYQTNMQLKGSSASNYAGYGLITSNNESAGIFGVYSNNENSLWIASDPDNLKAGSRIVFSVDTVDQASIASGGNFAFNSGYGSTAVAYGCRAWINFNGTGTPAIRGSGNVTSITDNGTGDYTVNFTTAFPDTNYCPTVGGDFSQGATRDNGIFLPSNFTFATDSLRISTTNTNGSYTDIDTVLLSIFR